MVVEVTRLGKCSSPRLDRMAQSLFHLQPAYTSQRREQKKLKHSQVGSSNTNR